MRYRTTEVIVGAFTLLALVVLVGVTVNLKKSTLFTRKDYEITARFRDVKRLEEGAPVLVYGVVRGDVRKIEATSDRQYPVRVVMMLVSGTVLHEGAKARVVAAGLVGETEINIEDGDPKGATLSSGSSIDGVSSMDISEILDRAPELIAHLQDSIAALSDIVTDEENRRAVSDILAAASSITLKIDQALGESGSDISEALHNINQATSQLATLITRVDSLVTTVSLDIAGASGSLNATINDLRTTAGTLVAQIQTVVEDIDDAVTRAGALVETAQAVLAENRDNTRMAIEGLTTSSVRLSRILARVEGGEDSVAELLLGSDSFNDLTTSLDTLKNSMARIERLLGGIDRWLTGTDTGERFQDIRYHKEDSPEKTQ